MKKIIIVLLLCLILLSPNRAIAATIELTPAEQEFINAGQVYVVGCTVDNCPLLFQNEKTNAVQGITVDILDMIAQSTGLRFRYQALPAGNITYADLQKLEVDLIASVESNVINQQAPGLLMSQPYLQAEKVFVCRRGQLFQPEGQMTIAVCSGSQTLEQIIKQEYPSFQVQFYNTTDEALNAVLNGAADAALQNRYTLERLLARPLYEDLQVVAAASIGDSHCLAYLLDTSEAATDQEAELLVSIINKGIASLNPSEVSFCIIKQTAENTYKLTTADLFYRYRLTLLLLGISLALILTLLWHNHILQIKRSEQQSAEQRAQMLTTINEHMREQQMLLRDALERAKEGSRAKSTFLFNMSHDIRTPMNAILGFTMIAYNNRDNLPKLTDSLEKIQTSGAHLLQLIDDILDMSRIESGKLTLTEEPCDLVETISKVKDVLQNELVKKKLTMQLDTTEVRQAGVYCDKLRMNQILFNLLSNAVKFSKNGGLITVTLRQQQSKTLDFASYELRVRDTGIGMSPTFIMHIFEPFEREHTSTVSRTQGTGLGMSITKSLVDLMGGTIEVQSEPDKGSEFILKFAFKLQNNTPAISASVEPQEEKPNFAGKRLLLVEDNELNREIAQELLADEGFTIETAENGQIAVDMVRRSTPGYYDAIIMDIQMPVMDGYQATRAIRRLENPALADIPIIAMTANAFNEDKREALATGMNAHIAKPVDIDLLRDTLKTILGL